MPIILDGTNGLDSPDLNITGTGARITGDFSNATQANRVSFQTSTANGGTAIQAIPNGNGLTSSLALYGTSDVPNSNRAVYFITSSEVSLRSDILGTGTYVPLNIHTGGSERLRITTDGVVELLSGQLKFPASQNASADANTLDDYEEGTWTPTLTGWNSITYVVRVGLYTKIGNQVTCWFDISVSAGTSTAGGVLVTGLPFTARANCVGGGMTSYADLPVSDRSYYAAYPTGSAINFYYFVSGGTTVSNANISGTRYLQGCVTYQV
jgi:hypothetical protein